MFNPDDRRAIVRFKPEIVQTAHIPVAHFLRAVVPDATRVHVILGVIPPLEAPPLDEGAYSLGLAVSEEAHERVKQTPFGKAVDVSIFRNWFDDQAVIASRKPPNTGPLRAAVISNHIAADVVTALDAQRGLKVDFFGVERQSVRVNGALLTKYDFVVSIGRTVLLSAACGVPCIMADIHGSDGLLTADKLDLARTVNFSGRLTKRAITRAHLRDEIEKLHSYDREALRSAVMAEYSLSSRTEWLLSRYESLLAASRAGRHKPESAATLPSEGLVYADLTTQNRSLRAELQAARSEIASLRSKAARR